MMSCHVFVFFLQDLIAQRMKEALHAMEVDVEAEAREGKERNRAEQKNRTHSMFSILCIIKTL